MTKDNDNVSMDFLIRQLDQYRSKGKSMPGDNGSSGDGGMYRIARVEAAVEHILRDISEMKVDYRSLRDNMRTDFRLLFGAIITVALGLAGLMAKGFHWL